MVSLWMFVLSLYPNYKCIHEHKKFILFFSCLKGWGSHLPFERLFHMHPWFLSLPFLSQFYCHLHLFFCIMELPCFSFLLFWAQLPKGVVSVLCLHGLTFCFFQIHCSPDSAHHCAQTIIFMMNDNFCIGKSSEYVLGDLYQVFVLHLTLLITLS